MHEEDKTFEEALQEAQNKGIAETNPLLDISGMDSACKLLLLTNSLMGNRLFTQRYTNKRNRARYNATNSKCKGTK